MIISFTLSCECMKLWCIQLLNWLLNELHCSRFIEYGIHLAKNCIIGYNLVMTIVEKIIIFWVIPSQSMLGLAAKMRWVNLFTSKTNHKWARLVSTHGLEPAYEKLVGYLLPNKSNLQVEMENLVDIKYNCQKWK